MIRVFAEVEREFLTVYYAPGMLTEENLPMLPPMHRFGWHCARAFDALDTGDALGCVHTLESDQVAGGSDADLNVFQQLIDHGNLLRIHQNVLIQIKQTVQQLLLTAKQLLHQHVGLVLFTSELVQFPCQFCRCSREAPALIQKFRVKKY